MKDENNLRVLLRYWRKRRGLSIEKLAKDAHVSTVTIQNIEKKGLIPRSDVLERLVSALNVALDELVVDASEDAPSQS